MQRTMLKSKIHRATVTDANLDYEGSISIDTVLIEAANLVAYEKVDVYNLTNGNRLSTYVIPGKSGEICMNGAAAHLIGKDDMVIIVSYANVLESDCYDFKPKVVLVDKNNKIKSLS